VTECDVAAKSEEFRAKQPGFVSLSFPTIAGSGPNGAIIHYRVSHSTPTSVLLGVNEVWLLLYVILISLSPRPVRM
jgi:Xaa-Pro aminopeptidase